MPGWVDAGFQEYALRMPRETPIELLQQETNATSRLSQLGVRCRIVQVHIDRVDQPGEDIRRGHKFLGEQFIPTSLSLIAGGDF